MSTDNNNDYGDNNHDNKNKKENEKRVYELTTVLTCPFAEKQMYFWVDGEYSRVLTGPNKPDPKQVSFMISTEKSQNDLNVNLWLQKKALRFADTRRREVFVAKRRLHEDLG